MKIAVAVVIVVLVVLVINLRPKFQWRGSVTRAPLLLLKEQPLEVEGTVTLVLPGTMFRVELDNGRLVLATISGKIRERFVRLIAGDRVKREMSPYDINKPRITWRLR